MATKKTATAKPAAKTTKSAAKPASKEKSLGELISALAEKTGVSKAKAKEFLEAHSEMITNELKENGSVHLSGIGKLKMGERAERQGRNPATGEPMTIKASKTVKFSGGKRFKDGFQ